MNTFCYPKAQSAFLGILMFALIGCSKDSDESSSGLAVAKGVYTITGPYCDDQKREPTFAVTDQPALFRKFSGLTERSVTIADGVLTEVQKDADCTLTVSTGIKSNADGKLGLSQKTSYTFDPADCTLAVATLAGAAEVGKSTKGLQGNPLFQDVPTDAVGGTLAITGSASAGYTSAIPELTASATGCGADESLATLRYLWNEKK
jgi:hypothetical protein